MVHVVMGTGKSRYSALKCESCGSIYPLQELGKNVSKDAITSMLKE
ncbi:MAG: hypothetical protein ACFFDR_06280 [Candidatus Thorarchaeota archaeon]